MSIVFIVTGQIFHKNFHTIFQRKATFVLFAFNNFLRVFWKIFVSLRACFAICVRAEQLVGVTGTSTFTWSLLSVAYGVISHLRS